MAISSLSNIVLPAVAILAQYGEACKLALIYKYNYMILNCLQLLV